MITNELKNNKVVLRIHSKDYSIEEITKLLDINPDKFLIKGSKAVPNNPKSYTRPENMWLLESGLESSEPLETHIMRLIEFIESRVNNLRKLINTCEIDIFCGYFLEDYAGYLSLSPEMLKRITILPIKLIVKLYPPSDSDEY